MKFLIFLVSVFFIVSCNDLIKESKVNSSQDQIPINSQNQPETQSQEKEESSYITTNNQNSIIEQEQKPIKRHKFVFYVVSAEEATYRYRPAEYYEGTNTWTEERISIDWNKVYFISKIQEYDDFDEDLAYREMDEAKESIGKKTDFKNMQVLAMLRSEAVRQQYLTEPRIRNKKVEYFEFDSYKEASIEREKLMNQGFDSEN